MLAKAMSSSRSGPPADPLPQALGEDEVVIAEPEQIGEMGFQIRLRHPLRLP